MNINKKIDMILGKKIKHLNLMSKKTKKDIDGDGILNKKDCNPNNPIQQDKITAEGFTRIFRNQNEKKFLINKSLKK